MPFKAKKYSAYEKIESRRLKPEVAFAFIAGLLFIGGIGYVLLDLMKSPSTIDSSKNQAILGEVKAQKESYQTIETTDYTVRIPEDWVNVNSPERIYEQGKRYYPDRYQGTLGSSNGRFIEIYTETIPDVPVDKVIAVSPQDDQLSVGALSQQCIEFTEFDERSGAANTEIETEWEDRVITCKRSESGNTIAAVATSTKNGFVLESETAKKRFLLIFADNGADQDNQIFRNILETFTIN